MTDSNSAEPPLLFSSEPLPVATQVGARARSASSSTADSQQSGMGQASLWGLDRIELAFTVEDRHTAGEIRRAAVQRCGLPGIPSDYVLVLIESAPGSERILLDQESPFIIRGRATSTVMVCLRQLRKSVSLRSLVAVADSGSPLAAAADNQGPTPLAPPTLAPLPIADVSDSLLWQMYGPILNDLLVSALAQVDHIVNAHQARRAASKEAAELLRDLESMSNRLSGAYRSLQNVARLQRPLFFPMPGYCIDACSNRATVEDAISLSARSSEAALPSPVTVDAAEPTLHYVTNVTLYQKHFTADGEPVPNQEHILAMDPVAGPVCITVLDGPSADPSRRLCRVLLWTREQSSLKVFPTAADQPVRAAALAEVLQSATLPKSLMTISSNAALSRSLLKLEQEVCEPGYKFGVLYSRDGQTTEDEMFSNVDASPAFYEFLDLLGTRIQLQGWTGYRGGLDVQNGTTGRESVFAKWRGLDIMLHVSTLLPFDPVNPQQLARKRHIGNDVCVIVFMDGMTSYLPSTINSRLNHVVALVRPNPDGTYSLAVAYRDTIMPFEPEITQPRYRRDESFRDLLFAKLVNGQNAAFEAPSFKEKLRRAREFLLSDIVRHNLEAAGVGDGPGRTSPNKSATVPGRPGTMARTRSSLLNLGRVITSAASSASLGESPHSAGSPGRPLSAHRSPFRTAADGALSPSLPSLTTPYAELAEGRARSSFESYHSSPDSAPAATSSKRGSQDSGQQPSSS